MTLRVEGKPDYTLILPADEKYLDAVKAYLDIDVFADAMLCDIRFKVPYIGELIRDTDCPAGFHARRDARFGARTLLVKKDIVLFHHSFYPSYTPRMTIPATTRAIMR